MNSISSGVADISLVDFLATSGPKRKWYSMFDKNTEVSEGTSPKRLTHPIQHPAITGPHVRITVYEDSDKNDYWTNFSVYKTKPFALQAKTKYLMMYGFELMKSHLQKRITTKVKLRAATVYTPIIILLPRKRRKDMMTVTWKLIQTKVLFEITMATVQQSMYVLYHTF